MAMRAAAFSSLTDRDCRVPEFLIAWASSRMTRSQSRWRSQSARDEHSISCDQEIEPSGILFLDGTLAGRGLGRVRDQKRKRGRKPIELCLPVGEQRGRHDEQARPGPVPFAGGTIGFAMQEQPDHLHRLSQAHVIGQASAQAQPGDEPQPAHAGLLIMPQLGVQSWRIGAGERLGRAELGERLLERGPGGQSDPIALFYCGCCCVLPGGHSG